MSDQSTSNPGDPDHYQGGASVSGYTPDAAYSSPPPLSNTDYRHARFRTFRLRAADYTAPAHGKREDAGQHTEADGPKLVVVGVCSAGKSTLVRALRERGYNAKAVSQEHSYVPYLWQRSKPDVLVYLDASLHTIRGRGRHRWPQSLLDEEHKRLLNARENCDIYIPTDGLAPEDVASRVVTFMSKRMEK